MKEFIASFFMICNVLLSFSQQDNPGCLETNLPIFTTIDGFYLTDNCTYTEFGSYEFVVDKNSRSIKKEGVYREVWFHKKGDSKRHVSGLQVLENYSNAIKSGGGEVIKESDGNIFKTTNKGKELWIYVNANTYSMDLDNYGIFSIEVAGMDQEKKGNGSIGTIGVVSIQDPQKPAGLAVTQNISGSTGLNLSPGAATDDTVRLSGLFLPAGALEAVLPTTFILTQKNKESANQQTSATVATGYPVHFIGENYGGGIVFYVYENGQHGLIAAPSDIGQEVLWLPNLQIPVYFGAAHGVGVGSGRLNTAIIIALASQGAPPNNGFNLYAAYACNAWFVFAENGDLIFGDWYLPSMWELKLLYDQKTIVGGLGNAYYWSSNQGPKGKEKHAWIMSFLTGDHALEYCGWPHAVRPIRSF